MKVLCSSSSLRHLLVSIALLKHRAIQMGEQYASRIASQIIHPRR
jgi:hypothetical protein